MQELESSVAGRVRRRRCSGSAPRGTSAAAAATAWATERLRRPCLPEAADRPERPTGAALATSSGGCGGCAFDEAPCTCSTRPVAGAATAAASRAAALATASPVLVELVDSVEWGFREREPRIPRPKTVQAVPGGGMALRKRTTRTAEPPGLPARAKYNTIHEIQMLRRS